MFDSHHSFTFWKYLKESSRNRDGIVCQFSVLVGNIKISLYHEGTGSIPIYQSLDTPASLSLEYFSSVDVAQICSLLWHVFFRGCLVFSQLIHIYTVTISGIKQQFSINLLDQSSVNKGQYEFICIYKYVFFQFYKIKYKKKKRQTI